MQEHTIVPDAAAFVEEVQSERRIAPRKIAQDRADGGSLGGEEPFSAHDRSQDGRQLHFDRHVA
jgi:hypothetical protein